VAVFLLFFAGYLVLGLLATYCWEQYRHSRVEEEVVEEESSSITDSLNDQLLDSGESSDSGFRGYSSATDWTVMPRPKYGSRLL